MNVEENKLQMKLYMIIKYLRKSFKSQKYLLDAVVMGVG